MFMIENWIPKFMWWCYPIPPIEEIDKAIVELKKLKKQFKTNEHIEKHNFYYWHKIHNELWKKI